MLALVNVLKSNILSKCRVNIGFCEARLLPIIKVWRVADALLSFLCEFCGKKLPTYTCEYSQKKALALRRIPNMLAAMQPAMQSKASRDKG